MKAEIDNLGNLFLSPESKTEEYGISKWMELNVNSCTGKPFTSFSIFTVITRKKPSLKQRIIHKLQLFYINHLK